MQDCKVGQSHLEINQVELHPYTVRKDALPEFFTDENQMYDALLNKSGATGVFTDFPDTGVELLKKQK